MKRLFAMLVCGTLLGACSSFHIGHAPNTAQRVDPPAKRVAAVQETTPMTPIMQNGVGIERVAFISGISSATVERLARQRDCVGGIGAGRITEPGPVEVYRMVCESGKVFLARCELRQCKAMQRNADDMVDR